MGTKSSKLQGLSAHIFTTFSKAIVSSMLKARNQETEAGSLCQWLRCSPSQREITSSGPSLDNQTGCRLTVTGQMLSELRFQRPQKTAHRPCCPGDFSDDNWKHWNKALGKACSNGDRQNLATKYWPDPCGFHVVVETYGRLETCLLWTKKYIFLFIKDLHPSAVPFCSPATQVLQQVVEFPAAYLLERKRTLT